MTVAFIALAALGLAALLVTVWLLVAGERRRMAATFLVAGLVLIGGAAAIVIVSNHNYDNCVDQDWVIRLGPPGTSSDACDGELVLDGILR